MKRLATFLHSSMRMMIRGPAPYYIWLVFLIAVIAQGVAAWWTQYQTGLIVTHMRDSVSWAFYIGNFTFLVGVAAAAVLLVIPAYVYDWKPIKEVALFGELLAVAAIAMCLLFVLVDMGRPDRFWHILPLIGTINLPSSLLAWDALVLNLYLLLNLFLASHMIYCGFHGRPYNRRIVIPLVIFSIPAAVGIHTVTAFLYNGLAARPYWNSAILAPRFLASAFCSGPAVMLILFQILRRTTRFEIKDEAIHKIAELMAYAMGFNLFLFAAEVFKEFYSSTHHLVHFQYLFWGLPGHDSPIAVYAWLSIILAVVSFILFIVPRTRRWAPTMNLGCVMIFASVYIEKGIVLIIPGVTPDVLGQVYEYVPSWTELRVSAGIFGLGFLLFTVMVKIAVDIFFSHETATPQPKEGHMNKHTITATALVCLWMIPVADAPAQDDRDPEKYISMKACAICHRKEDTGNQYAKWLEGPHAKAYEALGTAKAREVAAKYGIDNPQESGQCLKCHSTAYHWTEARVTEKVDVEDGVTCQSCHGPGADYKTKEIMADLDASIAAGLVYPATKSCSLCHNENNPTYDPERYTTKDGQKVDFDVEQAFEKIKHPRPKE